MTDKKTEDADESSADEAMNADVAEPVSISDTVKTISSKSLKQIGKWNNESF